MLALRRCVRMHSSAAPRVMVYFRLTRLDRPPGCASAFPAAMCDPFLEWTGLRHPAAAAAAAAAAVARAVRLQQPRLAERATAQPAAGTREGDDRDRQPRRSAKI